MKIDLSWIGIWLLVGGVTAVVVELGLMGLWSLQVARKSRALAERLKGEQSRLQADVERLKASLAMTQELWQPYRRLLRWLRHPIVVAVIQSYARRRVRA